MTGAWRVLAACALAIGGCAANKNANIDRPDPPPSYVQAAVAYNHRVSHFITFWAPVTVHYITRRDGKRETGKAEGHIQVVRPSKLALSVGKFGEVYFYLGSNDDEYWWFDMANADDKWALFGRHDAATPATVERFGLPIRPLDLMGVLGVLTLPETGGATSWSKDGRWLVVTVPGEYGSTRLTLDPRTFIPAGIELLDSGGATVVTAQLEESLNVLGAPVGTTTPMRYIIGIPALQAEIRITLRDAQVRTIRDIAFDRDRLMSAYKIVNVIDLDDRSPDGGGAGP